MYDFCAKTVPIFPEKYFFIRKCVNYFSKQYIIWNIGTVCYRNLFKRHDVVQNLCECCPYFLCNFFSYVITLPKLPIYILLLSKQNSSSWLQNLDTTTIIFLCRNTSLSPLRSNLLIVLIFMHLKIAIGVFNSFAKTRGAGPKPKRKLTVFYKFLDQQNWTYFLKFCCKKHNNMYPLDRAETDNPPLATNISNLFNPSILKWLCCINPFKCFRFITGIFPHPSF